MDSLEWGLVPCESNQKIRRQGDLLARLAAPVMNALGVQRKRNGTSQGL